MPKARLDQLVVDRGLAPSRERARALILAGHVLVDGKPAAKAGMHGFTMALAREVARKGVTVNSVSPGYCETAMVMAIPEDIRAGIVEKVPVGRLGQPEDIARAVLFLAADDAGFITGANLPVNGGLFMDF